MALNLITELEALVDALDADGVPYALCGDLALGIHGHPRATQNIGLLVQPEDLATAVVTVRRVGFDVLARRSIFGLRRGMHREVQRISKLDPETSELLPLDILIVNDELVDVWRERISVGAGRRNLSVVGRAGLATMKRSGGRRQDLVDLAKLEDTCDEEGEHVDMAPRAVTARLDTMQGLYDLTKYLMRFRPVDAAEREGLDASGAVSARGRA